MQIDFVYSTDCPNVSTTRRHLREALAEAGLPEVWEEHEIGHGSLPARVAGYGSPTILVDGKDIAGAAPGSSSSCRLYDHGESSRGVPSVEMIARAVGARNPK